MLRHNILISYRNFLRYKSSFFINLVGLSSGLACAIMIFLWVDDELRVDQFHAKADRLYQVMENVEQAHRTITRMSTAAPMAEALAAEMPEVELASTSTTERILDGVLSVEPVDVKAKGLYASRDFFRMFTFPLLQGNAAEVLSDKKNIVISEAVAISLFGTAHDLLGKTVEVEHKKQYKVSGVMMNLPRNSSIQFDYVLTFDDFKDENEWTASWFNTAPQTHVLLRPGADVEAFNRKIGGLVKTKTEGQANHRTPFIRRVDKAYLYNRYENGNLAGGRIDYVKLFSVIAVFIVVIACINFMNLSTARASRRLKEVGVKKVVGARQSNLVSQYLSESILISFFSLAVALALVWLILPQFNVITGKQLTITFDARLTFALLAIVLITGLAAGSYPALYLSRFKPVTVLKGKLTNFMGEVWARKGLVVFQFCLSIILIVSVWVVYEQIRYIQTKNLGYDRENVLIITREGAVMDKQETFLQELRKLPGVVAASATGHDMTGHNGGTYGVEWPGKDPEDRTEFERMTVDYGMIELLGMTMKEGRSFSREYGAEEGKIIFNEAAIEYMGMREPIGKKVKLWGEDREIVGVVKDFHFESFHERVKPAFFFMDNRSTGNIMVKLAKGREREAIAGIGAFYKSFNPGFPLSYRFLDADYQELYAAEERVSTLSKYFAGLAILISCLGLFGLAAFTTERRTKEIGIRKILGSTNAGIVYLISGEFTRMVVTAILIALPASYFLAQLWLDKFVFRIELRWWFFVSSGIAALLIAWLTVGLHTVRAAAVNPAKCLRNE